MWHINGQHVFSNYELHSRNCAPWKPFDQTPQADPGMHPLTRNMLSIVNLVYLLSICCQFVVLPSYFWLQNSADQTLCPDRLCAPSAPLIEITFSFKENSVFEIKFYSKRWITLLSLWSGSAPDLYYNDGTTTSQDEGSLSEQYCIYKVRRYTTVQISAGSRVSVFSSSTT